MSTKLGTDAHEQMEDHSFPRKQLLRSMHGAWQAPPNCASQLSQVY